VVIRRSHHIAALAAYLEPFARRGLLVHLTCSDPKTASVAPFGGRGAVITPNPMAWAWPGQPDPVMIDISASVTTNGMTARLARTAQPEGAQSWWLDAAGQPCRDPRVLQADPPGTILPLGGLDAGHKGYALALLVELLGGVLAETPGEVIPGGNGMLFIVLDPAAFRDPVAYAADVAAFCARVVAVPPAPGFAEVVLPGEPERRTRHERERGGIPLDDTTWHLITDSGVAYRIAAPTEVA